MHVTVIVLVLDLFRLQEAIEHCSDVPSYYFLLGKVYWELSGENNEVVSNSYSAFLKVKLQVLASKLNCFFSIVTGATKEPYNTVKIKTL